MRKRKSDLSTKSRSARRQQQRRLVQTEDERQKCRLATRSYASAARARESSTERARRLALQRIRMAQKRKNKGMTAKQTYRVNNRSTSTKSKLPKPFEIDLQPHFDIKVEKLEDTDTIKQEVEGEDYEYVDPLYVKTEDLDSIPGDFIVTPSYPCNADTVFSSSGSNVAVLVKTEPEEDECERYYTEDQRTLSPVDS